MISFVIGEIDCIMKNSIIINNNGIGYEIKVADATINQIISLGSNKKLKLYTFTSVKEDSICLYGFLSLQQLQTFNLLITVSGIGPKVAINILANIEHENFLLAIASEDFNQLSKIPGIGKKTAQRLVLELKDKINMPAVKINDEIENNEYVDAIEALSSLGYNRGDIIKFVSNLQAKNLSAQQIIKLALKSLNR